MGEPGLLQYVANRFETDGVGAVPHLAASLGSDAFVQYVRNPGEQIWDRPWDVLVILDACRVDLLRQVTHKYDFHTDGGTHYSIASKSNDWMRRTFVDAYREEVRETAYVSGNPFTAKVDFEVEPAIVDEVWRYAWNDRLATIPARPLTDRAIDTWRNRDADRMIVHYMQPHGPFVPEPDIGEYGTPDDFGDGFGSLWDRVGRDIPEPKVWNAYRENLEYVLDDVELMLENLDAETVAISADHGNAFGEWNVYGHPKDMLLPSVRRVPWVVTDAEDTQSYEPRTTVPDRDADEDAVEDRLQNLGYLG